MRLALSNIAWDPHEDHDVAQLLNRFEVRAIDIAHSKYFPDPANAKRSDIVKIKQWWADRGIEVTGMQALLYGTTGLNVFGDTNNQKDMLTHLRHICQIGEGLGAKRLVFGSPRNRDRSNLSDEQALDIATHFFGKVGEFAKEHGVIVCLEPNPVCYGANFMVDSEETARVVKSIDNETIRMQFDTGALTINGESPQIVLEKYAQLIGHVHVSEPDLLPIGDAGTDHLAMCNALRNFIPNHVVSIEMVATSNEPHLASIERALTFASKAYTTKSSDT